jgi:hypothetical protein
MFTLSKCKRKETMLLQLYGLMAIEAVFIHLRDFFQIKYQKNDILLIRFINYNIKILTSMTDILKSIRFNFYLNLMEINLSL